jgi:hypothetical protein
VLVVVPEGVPFEQDNRGGGVAKDRCIPEHHMYTDAQVETCTHRRSGTYISTPIVLIMYTGDHLFYQMCDPGHHSGLEDRIGSYSLEKLRWSILHNPESRHTQLSPRSGVTMS